MVPYSCAVYGGALPLMKVKVVYAMLASIASGAAVSVFVQGMEISSLINCLIFGYTSEGELGRILGGGGMLSMIEIVCIVALSSTYSGIFSGTSMLSGLQSALMPLMKKNRQIRYYDGDFVCIFSGVLQSDHCIHDVL